MSPVDIIIVRGGPKGGRLERHTPTFHWAELRLQFDMTSDDDITGGGGGGMQLICCNCRSAVNELLRSLSSTDDIVNGGMGAFQGFSRRHSQFRDRTDAIVRFLGG